MSTNLNLAVTNQPVTVIHVKWLHFSSFRTADGHLDVGQSGVRQCFDRLQQLDQTGLIRTVQESLCVCEKSMATRDGLPYQKIEFVSFDGPEAVGIDGRGITCKDMRIMINIDFHDDYSASDLELLVKKRNDVIELLQIELHMGDLIVQKTGMYDYLTYYNQ
ncbi:MAG: hypothetical protein ACC707_16435 [Thiohalomonadales bacterium]